MKLLRNLLLSPATLVLSFLLFYCSADYCFAELHEITPSEPKQCYSAQKTMQSGDVWTVSIRAEAADGTAWIFNDETFDPDYVLGHAATICLQLPECVQKMENEDMVDIALFLTPDRTAYLVVTFKKGAEQ